MDAVASSAATAIILAHFGGAGHPFVVGRQV